MQLMRKTDVAAAGVSARGSMRSSRLVVRAQASVAAPPKLKAADRVKLGDSDLSVSGAFPAGR